MLLHFELHTDEGARPIEVELDQLVIAGWAGRDLAAIEHHIEELAALGVSRPSKVPLYYRVSAQQLTQQASVQVLGPHSSGEVEAFVFAAADGQLLVSLLSDHTDRKLEAASVALSKQICPKPVARSAWRLADVAGHWDSLRLQAHIVENGKQVLYQDGPLASLRSPQELIAGYTGGALALPPGTGMSCGTVAALGGIRPASRFSMALLDPQRGCRIEHSYAIDVLPEVA